MRTARLAVVTGVALAIVAFGSPARAAAPEQLRPLDVTVDGVARTALIYVPPAPTDRPLPLVFAFHGHGGTSRQAARVFRLDHLWPAAISVYPQGLDTPGVLTDADGARPGWQHAIGVEGDRDLHFFDLLLAQLKHDHPVDPKRVYCTGHSNGGGFTYVLWQARPDVFAALAPCSAAAGFAARLTPKPAMICGGLNDPIVNFAWQQRTIDAVRRVDGCEPTGVPWEGAGVLFASERGTPLVTYTYPGGHPMDSAEPGLIVKFFQQHPGPTTRP
jgi:polyhydroxybutyrate depolymerase